MGFKLIASDYNTFKIFIEYMKTFEGYIPISYIDLYKYNLSDCDELIAVQRPNWLPQEIILCKKYSILNTEQLCDEKVQERIKKEISLAENIFKRNVDIYDYSLKNCEILNGLGYNTIYHPYKSCLDERNYLTELNKKTEKKYDVCFIGCLNDRRKKIINGLIDKGINIISLDSTYGTERDKILAMSKYILNIHYEAHFIIFETIRCNRLLEADFKIISEDSIDVPESTNLFLTNYDNLIDFTINKIMNKNK
jgi:hypothetical protein